MRSTLGYGMADIGTTSCQTKFIEEFEYAIHINR